MERCGENKTMNREEINLSNTDADIKHREEETVQKNGKHCLSHSSELVKGPFSDVIVPQERRDAMPAKCGPPRQLLITVACESTTVM